MNITAGFRRCWYPLSLFLLFLATLQLIIGCEENASEPGFADSLEVIRSAEPIIEAAGITMSLREGHDQGAAYLVDLSGIAFNPVVSDGTRLAWSIEYDVPPFRGTQENVNLYSTRGQELWKPLNQLLSLREELQQEYPALTWKELQVTIWLLLEHKPFAIDDIGTYEYFDPELFNDGQYRFDPVLVNQIVSAVTDTSAGRQSGGEPAVFAVIIENQGQTLIIEAEDVQTFTHSGELTTTQVNQNGRIRIKTEVAENGEERDLTYDLYLSDDRGSPVQGVTVYYSQLNSKSILYIRDPDDRYVSAYFAGTPDELAAYFEASNQSILQAKASGSDGIPTNVLATRTIQARISLVNTADAGEQDTGFRKLDRFFLSDQFERRRSDVNGDYILRCRAAREILNRMTGRIEAGSTVNEFLLFFTKPNEEFEAFQLKSQTVMSELNSELAEFVVRSEVENELIPENRDPLRSRIGLKILYEDEKIDDQVTSQILYNEPGCRLQLN